VRGMKLLRLLCALQEAFAQHIQCHGPFVNRDRDRLSGPGFEMMKTVPFPAANRSAEDGVAPSVPKKHRGAGGTERVIGTTAQKEVGRSHLAALTAFEFL
jgi:hypothetical protein